MDLMDWNEPKQTRKVLERARNELVWTQNGEKKYGKALEKNRNGQKRSWKGPDSVGRGD